MVPQASGVPQTKTPSKTVDTHITNSVTSSTGRKKNARSALWHMWRL
jgi:hypothetical protein